MIKIKTVFGGDVPHPDSPPSAHKIPINYNLKNKILKQITKPIAFKKYGWKNEEKY